MAEVALASDAARLAEVARVFKAAARSVTLYPNGHPTIETTLSRLTQLTNPPALTSPLRIGITPGNLLIDGLPVGKPDAVISDLASLLHSHLVGELTVLPGGNAAAWRRLLLLIERAPDEVRADGGIARLWAEAGASHVELREIDYAAALRERWSGAEITWERVVGNCLKGDDIDIPPEFVSAFLQADTRTEAITDAFTAVEKTNADAANLASRADTLIKLAGGVAKSVASRSPDHVEPVMRELSAALGRLSPEMLASVIQRLRQKAAGIDPGTGAVVEGMVEGMTDATISAFLARNTGAANASGFAAPVERVVQAFQALVWDGTRRERLVSLAQQQAQEAAGHDPNFEGHWRDVAQKLLKQYDDQSYVSESYALELMRARTQAVQIEQLKEDPSEQVEAWVSTVATSELRKLDIALVVDLLTIEKEPERRESLVQPVLALLKDLLMVGDFDAIETMLAALCTRGPGDAEPSAVERTVLERLPTGATVQHLVGHLATIDESHLEQVKRVCVTLGEPVVQPLTEALAIEDRTRIRERLTETIVGFGHIARQHVEQLKESPDAAIRRTAIYLLRELGVSEAPPELNELVSPSDARAQQDAVHAVIRVGTNRAYRMLVQALTTVSPVSREAIMQAVGNPRDERAVPLLLHILEHVDHAGELGWAYERSIELLGHLRHTAAVPAMVTVLQRGEWWAPRRTAQLRATAATALGRIGTPEAIAALTTASLSGPRGARKAAAAQLQTAGASRRAKDGD
ncbi:MAG: HEAT repeat domain-containing protein [Vicinamibacterales bacterium]